MTRILQLVSRDEPGGVQVLTHMVEAGLRQRGYEITTLPLAVDGSPWRQLQHLTSVARDLLRGGYDAVLSYQAAAGVVAAALGTLGRIPFRAVHQTAMPHAVRPHWRLLDRCCGVLGGHTAIIANSRATAAAFASYPPAYRARLRLIAHGVPPLPHVAAACDWRAALSIPASSAILVSTGRLTGQKNHAVAVAALAGLPDAHLIIAGEGSERANLLAIAQRLGVATRLHLIGDCPRAQLGDLLAAADVYLFPSVWETFGLAVAEAGMTGLPIVAADLPVLREVLEPAAAHGLARFHPPMDVASLASAIRTALDNYPDATSRAAAAQAMAARHGIAPMLDAYELLLEGATRPSS